MAKNVFEVPAEELAKWLIGKELHYGEKSVLITETEAYGADDPTCYGVRYGKNNNTSVSFNKGGHLFVYGGMLMITAGENDTDSQNVLIRAGEKPYTNGPCKLKDYLGIDKAKMNGKKIEYNSVSEIYIKGVNEIAESDDAERVGIKSGRDNIIKDYVRRYGKSQEEVAEIVDEYIDKKWNFKLQSK